MLQTFESSGGPKHVAERVKALRALLATLKVDAVIVPSADEHQGEYVPACAERLKWLTGFSGSAGVAIVTRKAAVLITDGRYSVQARAETDTKVVEVAIAPRERMAEWLAEKLGRGQSAGFDPWLHTATEIARRRVALEPKGITLEPLSKNPIDELWGAARPKPPAGAISLQPLEYSGKAAADKIAALQKSLIEAGQHAAVMTLSDTICWLFNIRGSDVAHNPVVRAYAIVPAKGKAALFLDPERVGKDERAHLNTIAKLFHAKDLASHLKALKIAGKLVRFDPDTGASAIERALGPKVIGRGQDLCILPKAIKNETEIAGARAAHARDGAAVARFLAWLDRAVAEDAGVDEISAVRMLEQFRHGTNALCELSFPTISGSGPNGAIVHYRVSKKSNRRLLPGELFLVDSGAQYRDGTTDITRTIAIGSPSDEMRTRFTAVLKGHIAIATARFPKGTRGIDLDPFARRALWDLGSDYDHGTGHGIGSYLSVHEGPQSISRGGMAPLQPGMLVSNEPGFYKEGAYGIRIENVVLVTAFEKIDGGERDMMSFETLTLAPIDRRLVAADMLSPAERDWLNAYHARVFKALLRSVDSETALWLEGATAEI